MARITKELKEDTEACIIEAATKSFIEHGFEKTKTKAIATHCHIAEGTLFNYFKTKDDLLVKVFETLATDSHESLTTPSISPMDYLLDLCFSPLRQMNKIPKGFMLDLLMSSMKLAKKKPHLFHRLLALDKKYLETLEANLVRYCEFPEKGITSSDLSSMIYAILAADYFMYLYLSDQDEKAFIAHVSPKLRALITPYLKEAFL